MINPLVNSIVISAFGFLIGIILQITMMVMPEKNRQGGMTSKTSKGLQRFMERVRENQQEGRDVWKNKSAITAMITFYAVIAILILVIKYSPLEMHWTVFLVSTLIGFAIFEIIHERAKARTSLPDSDSSNNSRT